LFPHLSVHDNIAFGLRMQRVPGRNRERVAEAITLVSLGGCEDRNDQLSGGQDNGSHWPGRSRRVPGFVLDEPLSALDARLGKACNSVEAPATAVKTTFVFVTQHQEEALDEHGSRSSIEPGRAAGEVQRDLSPERRLRASLSGRRICSSGVRRTRRRDGPDSPEWGVELGIPEGKCRREHARRSCRFAGKNHLSKTPLAVGNRFRGRVRKSFFKGVWTVSRCCRRAWALVSRRSRERKSLSEAITRRPVCVRCTWTILCDPLTPRK